MAKAGNLKLDFMAKSIEINFLEFEDMFRCYRDSENLKRHFGHMDTLNPKESENGFWVSLPNRSIQDLSDHGMSKEPKNPLPERMFRSLEAP